MGRKDRVGKTALRYTGLNIIHEMHDLGNLISNKINFAEVTYENCVL